MQLLFRCAVIAVLAFLSACATVVKLDAPMTEADKAAHVVIFMEQSEVAVDDADVSSGGGGLIGALIESAIESSMTKRRQETIAPLRDVLINYDFESKLIATIKSNLPTSLVKADANVVVVRNDEQWRTHVESVIPSNVLLVTTRYAFEQNFDIAYIYATVQLDRHSRAPPTPAQWKQMSGSQRKQDAPVTLHNGRYYSQHVSHDPFVKLEQEKGEAGYEANARDWAKNGAEQVRIAFEKGMQEIASLIQRDGNRSLPSVESANTVRAFIGFVPTKPTIFSSKFLQKSGDRTLVQLGIHTIWVDDLQIKRRK